MLQNDRKKVVNTEEQNLPVNPGDRTDEETVPTQNEQVSNDSKKSEADNPAKGNEEARPRHVEGDEDAGIDRKVPKL